MNYMVTQIHGMLKLLSIMVLSVIVAGCGSDEPTGPGEGEGRITMFLVDLPTDLFTQVNVEIESVEIYSDVEGWVVLEEESRIFNLMELTNGQMALLADAVIEAGVYTRIRLSIGSQSSVTAAGNVFDLELAAGAQEGVEIEQDVEVRSLEIVELIVDFDAHHSIIGSLPALTLDPIIRVEVMHETGIVEGVVAPAEAFAVIILSQEGEVVSSTYADEIDGRFSIMGIPAGAYDAEVVAREGDYQSMVIFGVSVAAGDTTDIGTVELSNGGEGIDGDE